MFDNNIPVSLAQEQHGPDSAPLPFVVSVMFLIGIGAAAVFLFVVAPLFPEQSIRTVFDHSRDANKFLQGLNKGSDVNHGLVQNVCGNHVCEKGETTGSCLQDCFVCNMNGVCESGLGENSNSCSHDCVSNPCNTNGVCDLSTGEDSSNCPADCVAGVESNATCGDKKCGASETCSSCSKDCGVCPPACGNGLCESGETASSCPADCSAPTCSDGIKNQGETDVDCGGAACSACLIGKMCLQNSDCSSQNCLAGLCYAGNCTDSDKDGYVAGQNCNTLLDCDDQNPGAHPNAAEVCSDGVDNSCDGLIDEGCISLDKDCPIVSKDARKNLLVNNVPFFPAGFWSNYYSVPNWNDFTPRFNALVDGYWSGLDQLLLQNNGRLMDQVGGDSSKVDQHEIYSSIIAFEVVHEPWSFGFSDQDVINQANGLRNADHCSRAVWVTPSNGTIDHLPAVQSAVDLAAVQAGYVVPLLPIKRAGQTAKKAVSNMGNKPAIAVLRIEGFLSNRYRVNYREPTFDEMRVIAYDTIITGVKGIMFYPYKKGSSDTGKLGFSEIDSSEYDVTDSPAHYSDVLRVGTDLKNHLPIISSLFSSQITVQSDNPDVHCGIWDVLEFGQNKNFVICANTAQDHAPYFDYQSGDIVLHAQAQAHTSDGSYYPAAFHQNSFFDENMDPGSVSVQDISTGITNQNKIVDKISVYFGGAPPNATFTYAIYADDARDLSPHTRLFVSSSTAVPQTPGTYEFAVPNITLEHTKQNFLLFKADNFGITIRRQDVRYGARVRDSDDDPSNGYQPVSPVPLDASFGVLYQGKQASATITLSGGNFSSYCAQHDDSGNCSQGSISNNSFSDSFTPYGVYIYKLG